MINLFETFNMNAVLLYESFKYLGLNPQTAVIDDDGFLPDDIETPYKLFSGTTVRSGKPLFFNEVRIPKTWMIEGYDTYANIIDNEHTMGKIFYRNNGSYRTVERVEWLGSFGHTFLIDYYNQYGKKYAEVVMNSKNQRKSLRHYFDDNRKVLMTENFNTHDVELEWNNKSYHFHTKADFIQFYLNEKGWGSRSFLINSYGHVLSALNQLSNSVNNIIFNQQQLTENQINHLELLLKEPNNKYRALINGQNNHDAAMKMFKEEFFM